MPENKPPKLEIYHKAPTTATLPNEIAAAFGYFHIFELLSDLPKNAQVLDVGAGVSMFGFVATTSRPDITWHHLDYAYRSPELVALLPAITGRRKLSYEPGDATELDQYFSANSMDAVFSYDLFPHLSLDSPEPALRAVRQMHKVAKKGGQIMIGPTVGDFAHHSALTWQKGPKTKLGYCARTVLEQTRLHGRARYVRRLLNEIGSAAVDGEPYKGILPADFPNVTRTAWQGCLRTERHRRRQLFGTADYLLQNAYFRALLFLGE